jgi:hypothetical protein
MKMLLLMWNSAKRIINSPNFPLYIRTIKKQKMNYLRTLAFFLTLIALLPCCQAAPAVSSASTSDTIPAGMVIPVNFPLFAPDEDRQAYQRIIASVKDAATPDLPLHTLIQNVALHFLSTPYVASTLEIPGDEQLVINLRQLDCTTYVEYVLAISMAARSGDTSFENFSRNLAFIRYRNGSINGYPSRLHYFTEWLNDNARKGVIEIISNSIGTAQFVPSSGFMSKNPNLYRQLENAAFVESIRETEKLVSGFKMQFIPKGQIEKLENKIQDGDIIAFTTNIAGLDVSHTGFAFYQNGRLHLLHASSRTNMVEITTVPLSDYLKPMNRVTGILVGRIK